MRSYVTTIVGQRNLKRIQIRNRLQQPSFLWLFGGEALGDSIQHELSVRLGPCVVLQGPKISGSSRTAQGAAQGFEVAQRALPAFVVVRAFV